MTKLPPSEYMELLKWGGSLDDETIAEIKASLSDPDPDSDIYNLARALALSSPATDENVAIVEQYLNFETDDWNLGGVILALCSYWELTGEYIDFLMELTEQEKWEGYPESIIRAFPQIGMYCYNQNNHEIIRKLFNRFKDDCTSIQDNLYCQIALGAIAYAVDHPQYRLHFKDYTVEEKDELIKTAMSIVERNGRK